MQLIVDVMAATILAWQRDLHALHDSQGSIVVNCSNLGGSVPTFDIKNIALFYNGSVPFFCENLINMHIFSTTFFFFAFWNINC